MNDMIMLWWNINKKMITMIFATFAFFAFVNWHVNPGEWNGFSRFVCAFISIMIVVDKKYY